MITFFILAGLFILFFIYHIFILPHPKSDSKRSEVRLKKFFNEFIRTFASFFKKKEILLILLFILFYRFAEAQLAKMTIPFLVDTNEAGGLALTTSQVGVVYGTVGIIALSLGGILGGIAAGLYILGGRIVRKNVSVWSYAIIVYSITTVILFLLCISLNSPIYGFSFKDYSLIFIMAIFAGILGHTLYNWSLEYVRASIASVVLLGEPIGSSILAFLLPWISQIPSEYTIIGGTIILFGIYLTARKTKTIYYS